MRVSGDLIRLLNRSKLVERSLFAIIDLLQGTKSHFLYFIWRVGKEFYKNFKILEKNFHFILFHLFFHVFTAAPYTLKGSRKNFMFFFHVFTAAPYTLKGSRTLKGSQTDFKRQSDTNSLLYYALILKK